MRNNVAPHVTDQVVIITLLTVPTITLEVTCVSIWLLGLHLPSAAVPLSFP